MIALMPHAVARDASCREIGYEGMEVDKGDRDTSRYIRERVCGRCPVLDACAAWALDHVPTDDQAIYGGMTARERGSIRAARKRADRVGVAA